MPRCGQYLGIFTNEVKLWQHQSAVFFYATDFNYCQEVFDFFLFICSMLYIDKLYL